MQPSAPTPVGAQAQRRYLPFCNVPIAMQLQHYQQWQQLDLPHTTQPNTTDAFPAYYSIPSGEMPTSVVHPTIPMTDGDRWQQQQQQLP